VTTVHWRPTSVLAGLHLPAPAPLFPKLEEVVVEVS
jgi:hypothetical protein